MSKFDQHYRSPDDPLDILTQPTNLRYGFDGHHRAVDDGHC